MTKSLCALRHRSGSDRAAFQLYYEQNHAPLAVRHFPFRGYVRNHLIDADDLGYDTISEFWAEDIGATAALMQGPIGDILRADEAKFMDRSVIAPAGAEEHVLSHGNPVAGDGMRVATLIAASGPNDAAFRAALGGWASDVARRLPGVSLDFVTAWDTPAFPAAAVLWSPHAPGEPPAAFAAGVRHLNVRRIETPPEALLGNAG